MRVFTMNRKASKANEKTTREPKELDPEIAPMAEPTTRSIVNPDEAEEPRTSAAKPLPSPPTTASKKITMKPRFSAILVFIFTLASFILGICVVAAGPGNLRRVFMFKLDTSRLGQDLIRLETTTSTSLTPLTLQFLESILGDLTDSLTSGLEGVINSIAQAFVKEIGVKDVYFLYLTRICEGSFRNGTDGTNNAVTIERCFSYEHAAAGVNARLRTIPSSTTIGQINISIPALTQLLKSAGSLSSVLLSLRRALFAFIVISLITLGISMLLSIPSIIYRNSRLLIYINLIFTLTSTLFTFLFAIILSALIAGVLLVVGELGNALGLGVERGGEALAFGWVIWLVTAIVSGYWEAVWFVEVRRWSFIKRGRTQEDIGNWRGIGKEVWRDWKGER